MRGVYFIPFWGSFLLNLGQSQPPFNTHARTHGYVKAVIGNFIVLHFRFFQIGPKRAVI